MGDLTMQVIQTLPSRQKKELKKRSGRDLRQCRGSPSCKNVAEDEGIQRADWSNICS